MIGLLAKLADDDPEAAREALAALDWITGEQDLRVLTQERLQTFLWYELPSKWMTEPEERSRSLRHWPGPSISSTYPGTRRSAGR